MVVASYMVMSNSECNFDVGYKHDIVAANDLVQDVIYKLAKLHRF